MEKLEHILTTDGVFALYKDTNTGELYIRVAYEDEDLQTDTDVYFCKVIN